MTPVAPASAVAAAWPSAGIAAAAGAKQAAGGSAAACCTAGADEGPEVPTGQNVMVPWTAPNRSVSPLNTCCKRLAK